MAVSEQRILPPEFIEAAGKTYLDDLSKAVGGFKAADLSQTFGPQFVAGPGALQTQAEGLAGGLGSFAPFLQTAAAQAGDAATQAGLAGQFVGPQAYQQFMSPFQQDVIKTSLADCLNLNSSLIFISFLTERVPFVSHANLVIINFSSGLSTFPVIKILPSKTFVFTEIIFFLSLFKILALIIFCIIESSI